MHAKARLVRWVMALAFIAASAPSSTAAQLLPPPPPPPPPLRTLATYLLKLDPLLQARAFLVTGQSRVIVRAVNGGATTALAALIHDAGGSLRRSLPIIEGHAATVPNASLLLLASSSLVQHLSLDR